MVSQVVDAVTPAAESKERHVRQLDPNMPIPKERLQGMPLSRYVGLRQRGAGAFSRRLLFAACRTVETSIRALRHRTRVALVART